MQVRTIGLLVGLSIANIAHAADIAPTYGVPGYQGRVGLLVQGCPSSDGSNTVVACTSGGGGTVTTQPAPFTPAALSASTVTTGGTAVTAVAAGGATHGGYIFNPAAATTNLCVNIVAAATTTDGGATTCILPGTRFTLPPTTLAVSVNATDSGHAFSGARFP